MCSIVSANNDFMNGFAMRADSDFIILEAILLARMRAPACTAKHKMEFQ